MAPALGAREDLVALVTGTGNAVGAAVGRLLASAGVDTWFADRDAAAAQRAAGAQVGARAIAFDPVDESQWAYVSEQLTKQSGGLDLLVNAAQAFRFDDVECLSPDRFMDLFNRNGTASWLGMKYGIPLLRARGGGRIVNVTSVLARTAAAGCSATCAAARGILMATKSAALECARERDGILVNAVLAGRMDDDPEHFPDGRVLPNAVPVAAQDVAAAVVFLLTEESGYVTGLELPVDAGFLAA
ncbi:MAG: SDR family oxidoreductase [Gammaproteobacteria bacterium]|nr:SDR family oxidoreductase [Gammaproteobacteria bacterium]